MSAVALTTSTHVGGTRYPLWVLFLALGTIAAAGGTASLISEDDPEGFGPAALDAGDMVLIPRAELEALRRGSVPIEPETRPPVPPRPIGPARAARSPKPVAAGKLPLSSGTDTYPPSRGLEAPSPPAVAEADLLPPTSPIPSPHPDPTLRELDDLAAELARRRPPPSLSPPNRQWPREANEPPGSMVPPAGRAELMALGLPESPPDPADSWIDPAQLPPEFAHLLAEIYPPERVGVEVAAPGGSVPIPPPTVGACPNCARRVTVLVAECSECHRALCRSCGSLARLTSDRAVCNACVAASASRLTSSKGR